MTDRLEGGGGETRGPGLASRNLEFQNFCSFCTPRRVPPACPPRPRSLTGLYGSLKGWKRSGGDVRPASGRDGAVLPPRLGSEARTRADPSHDGPVRGGARAALPLRPLLPGPGRGGPGVSDVRVLRALPGPPGPLRPEPAAGLRPEAQRAREAAGARRERGLRAPPPAPAPRGRGRAAEQSGDAAGGHRLHPAPPAPAAPATRRAARESGPQQRRGVGGEPRGRRGSQQLGGVVRVCVCVVLTCLMTEKGQFGRRNSSHRLSFSVPDPCMYTDNANSTRTQVLRRQSASEHTHTTASFPGGQLTTWTRRGPANSRNWTSQ